MTFIEPDQVLVSRHGKFLKIGLRFPVPHISYATDNEGNVLAEHRETHSWVQYGIKEKDILQGTPGVKLVEGINPFEGVEEPIAEVVEA